MHAAAMMGQQQTAELLITQGADVNAKGISGGTPSDRLDDVAENAANPFYKVGNESEIADLLHKHGGKTGAELKAEGE